ncbi:MAG: DNA polymerase III subunit delta [Chloroflexi bacterium]|nr:DNA polymerase III subunit delta [Chloroflexota bacterium]
MFLLIAEDPFRARLRLAELVSALTRGGPTDPGDASVRRDPTLGMLVGVTRHDARYDTVDAIAMSGRSQGLFDAPDEHRVVIVDSADALTDASFIAEFPPETALVLVTAERTEPRRRARAKKENDVEGPADISAAVEDAGGRVERIARLAPDNMATWISARARLHGIKLEPAAIVQLASATGTDTQRVEQELHKLATYAAGAAVTAADVRSLVSGAIETEIFDLTRAVIRHDAKAAVDLLQRLLAEGNAPLQILALLLWQFRVVLFAGAMKSYADAERFAKAIRSSAGAINRWRAEAPRFTRADVIRAYESLYATDVAIKQGRTDEETALMLCVLDLCGVPGADTRELIVGTPPKR